MSGYWPAMDFNFSQRAECIEQYMSGIFAHALCSFYLAMRNKSVCFVYVAAFWMAVGFRRFCLGGSVRSHNTA